MRILITGKNGQLGSSLQDIFFGSNYSPFFFSSSELNIASEDQVTNIFTRVKPDIVINAAAYTSVDKAESEPEIAYLVNARGPELLAKQASKLNIPLIHISTDYVFDGTAIHPYSVDSITEPRTVYGASKLAGEKAVKRNLDKYIILRTSWVFSEYGNNFVKTMVRLAKEREELGVVADQYGCPTYAGDLAKAIFILCTRYEFEEKLPWGTYHYCGDQPTSWHGFARSIFALTNQASIIPKKIELKAIDTLAYPTPALRPEYSVLDTSELLRLGVKPSNWLKALHSVVFKLKK